MLVRQRIWGSWLTSGKQSEIPPSFLPSSWETTTPKVMFPMAFLAGGRWQKFGRGPVEYWVLF